MLDNTTKKRIDDCRDILVGKLPDPKSQIEQITIALIYKFMDDMDKESIDLGGEAKFFSGGFEKYSWNNLFNAKVTATEMLKLYSESIESMEKNPNIPQLFRDIFKNAYLPYRDPETLKLFLKTIGEFEYTHSEKLGDAFEYLLSVMGSQGDAGQFRTPRHIIDFLVKAVDPSKKDTILDPACGTAGFLISAFKRIKEKNNNQLTPDERTKLIKNFIGYDISPDMVRLSLVNLYLHGFSDPHIFEYDTLTSEERWNDNFDVVLANPPFMSPKGGIRPHKKFTVTSNRSEVLFVDYIADHLNPKGRAGIIVPEGVIFQSGKAYKELRKMLVESYLYAVVSLPAGVFNPYSGVKTSILLMDKTIAKKTNKILFVKIDNDGYNLGAQRNAIKGGQLSDAIEILNSFRASIENSTDFENIPLAHAVEKSKIAENGEFNLSGERYKISDISNSDYEIVSLSEIAEIQGGYAFKSSELKNEKKNNDLPVIKIGNLDRSGKVSIKSAQYYSYHPSLEKFLIQKKDVLVAMTGATVGKVAISSFDNLLLNQRVGLVRSKSNKLNKDFLSILLLSDFFYEYCQTNAGGGAQG
ncbi:MAG: N-6 DNA methylase, partial [Bacteroidales bacterium]|nr:N-6 DNA methylase [Bacteroidales bacterium]